MLCPNCREEIRTGLVFCPLCGRRVLADSIPGIDEGLSQRPSWLLFIGVMAFIAVAFGAYETFMYFKVKQMRELGMKAQVHGDYRQCIEFLSYAIRKNPKGSGAARIALSDCYLQAGKPEQALEQMKTGASWAPKDAKLLAAWTETLYRAGTACPETDSKCRDERFSDAVDKAGEALKLEPKNQRAMKFGGMAMIKTKQFVEAEKMLTATLKGVQGDEAVELQNQLAEAYLGMGKNDKALAALEASLKLYMNQPETLTRAADLYLKKQNFVKCKEYAESALEISMQDKDKAGMARAQKYVDACRAVVLAEGIRGCIENRRKLDVEYVALDNDMLTFVKEVEAEPEEFTGKPSPTLSYIYDASVVLKEKYSRLDCKTDYEAIFKKSVWTFIGQLDTLGNLVQAMSRFIETQDSDASRTMNEQRALFSKQRDAVMNTWHIEEEKFGFKPLLKGARGETLDEKTTTPTPAMPQGGEGNGAGNGTYVPHGQYN